MAIAVPGELKGYVEAKEKFGNPDLSLLDIMKPTIDLCENGFQVTRSLERAINQLDTKEKFDDNLKEEFTNPITGQYYKKGDIIRRTEYATTLRKIAESGSSDIFYQGEIGQSIVQEIQDLGGIITMEDMRSYQ